MVGVLSSSSASTCGVLGRLAELEEGEGEGVDKGASGNVRAGAGGGGAAADSNEGGSAAVIAPNALVGDNGGPDTDV